MGGAVTGFLLFVGVVLPTIIILVFYICSIMFIPVEIINPSHQQRVANPSHRRAHQRASTTTITSEILYLYATARELTK